MGLLRVWFVALIPIVLKCVRCTVQDDVDVENLNVTTSNMEGYIVGGDFGEIESFPHAVFLYAECAKSLWTCGSSVLNQEVLLTAAHCVYSCRGHFKINAYAGSSNYAKAKIARKVARYVIHRDYDDESVKCDIAVLMLDKMLPYSKSIKRLIIRPDKPKGHTKAVIAGWGSINEEQEISTNIKYVDQTVWLQNECEEYLSMHKGTICACQGRGSYPYTGDSGSSLVTNDYQAIGVVSYRVGSIKKDLVVYTDVSHYYNWIKEKVYIMYCHKKQ